jgi:hypothetical protein
VKSWESCEHAAESAMGRNVCSPPSFFSYFWIIILQKAAVARIKIRDWKSWP